MTKLKVCSVHFPDYMVVVSGQRRKLKDDAYPTLYLPHTRIDSNCAVAGSIQDYPSVSTEVAKSNNVPPIYRESEPSPRIFTRKIISPARNHKVLRKIRKCSKKIYREKRNNRLLRKRIARLKEEEKNLWEKATEDFPTVNKTFTDIIYKNYKKAPQGHRYDSKEKALALILYKSMGKRAYTCLRGIFQEIPSIQSLRNVLNSVPFVPGINDIVLKHLRTVSGKMSTNDKACILMWDEVSIHPNLTYDIQKDIICGFEDWGNHRTNKFADHALVFMLRGLHSGCKLPISFNFCTNMTNTFQLMRCIKEHILAVNNAGFHVLATVCDQGANNMTAIKGLLQRT